MSAQSSKVINFSSWWGGSLFGRRYGSAFQRRRQLRSQMRTNRMLKLVRVRSNRWTNVEVYTRHVRAGHLGGHATPHQLSCREPGTRMPHAADEGGHRPLPSGLRA